ncbi:MAG: hypothetical protein GYA80_09915, partial [Chloroflexi bacterium]|nr:hypothetical protein [Chloroflexota bacterium]
MAATLILLSIGLPWLGALVVWMVGDRHEKIQHALAVAFSLAAGVAAVILLGSAGKETALTI